MLKAIRRGSLVSTRSTSSPRQECGALTETLESGHPGLLIEQAILSAMQGQLDEARRLNQRARHSLLEEMRARRMLMFLARSQATVECLARDLLAASQQHSAEQASSEAARLYGLKGNVVSADRVLRLDQPRYWDRDRDWQPTPAGRSLPDRGRRNDRHDKPAQRPAFRPLTCTLCPCEVQGGDGSSWSRLPPDDLVPPPHAPPGQL
jgi:hypothetical protein